MNLRNIGQVKHLTLTLSRTTSLFLILPLENWRDLLPYELAFARDFSSYQFKQGVWARRWCGELQTLQLSVSTDGKQVRLAAKRDETFLNLLQHVFERISIINHPVSVVEWVPCLRSDSLLVIACAVLSRFLLLFDMVIILWDCLISVLKQLSTDRNWGKYCTGSMI